MPSQDHWWRPATSQLARLGLRALVVWTLGCVAAAALLIALVTATKLLSGFPLVIQLALGVLLLLAAVLIAGMLRERRAVLQAHHQFLKIFDSIKPLTANEKTTGLSPEKMAEIRRRTSMLAVSNGADAPNRGHVVRKARRRKIASIKSPRACLMASAASSRS